MQYKIHVIRSQRKTIGLEIREDLQVILRIPKQMKEKEIREFLERKKDWLEQHYSRIESTYKQPVVKLTTEQLQDLTEQARLVIPQRVRKYAPLVGVDYGRITIRRQKTRWGSCSSKGNLNFNCMLMKAPDTVIDYVVVHELCHLLEMNHSKKFWLEVARVFPEYQKARCWLKEKGSRLIQEL